MKPPATTFVGPLGSTVHVIRADAGTIAELAAVDWSRHFRRVCLDPVRGLITLMSPSHLHEDLAEIFDDIVETAADGLARISKKLGSVRLRGSGEPPGTGMEADCTFYVGERAERYQAASAKGEAAAEAFLVDTAPDLVVETEITSADEGKAERYARIGVREIWRLHGRRGSRELRADFPRLAAGRTAAAARRLGGAGGPDPGGRVRGGGRRAARRDPGRADGGGGPRRPASAAQQRAGRRTGPAPVSGGSRTAAARSCPRGLRRRRRPRKPPARFRTRRRIGERLARAAPVADRNRRRAARPAARIRDPPPAR